MCNIRLQKGCGAAMPASSWFNSIVSSSHLLLGSSLVKADDYGTCVAAYTHARTRQSMKEKEHRRWKEGRGVAALALRMSKRLKCATVAATTPSAFLTIRTSAEKVSTCAEGHLQRIVSLLTSSTSCLHATVIRDALAHAKCKAESGPNAARCTSD